MTPHQSTAVARLTAAAAGATGVGRLIAGSLTPNEQEEQLDRLAGFYAERTDVRHRMVLVVGSPLRARAELTVPDIYVARARDGQTVESRDYTDHVAMARGLAGPRRRRWPALVCRRERSRDPGQRR
jgi:hypothetical protein